MIQRWICTLLTAAMLFSLPACGSDPQPTVTPEPVRTAEETCLPTPEPTETPAPDPTPEPETEPQVTGISMLVGQEYDYTWSNSQKRQVGLFRTGNVELAADEAEKYPALAAALEEYFAEHSASMREYYTQLMSAPDSISQGLLYRLEDTASIRRADSVVTSILLSGSSYTGGAHGSAWYGGVNLDSQTGERLSLSDLTTDMDELGVRVQRLLEEQYPEVTFYAKAEDAFHDAETAENIIFTVDSEGLTFYFGQYELTAYAFGMQLVTMPYYGNEDILTAEYFAVPESRVCELECWVPYLADMDGDGISERVEIRAWENQDGAYEDFTILVDDVPLKHECWSFGLKFLLIRQENGRNLLYVQSQEAGDWNTLLCFEMTVAGAKYIGCLDEAFGYSWVAGRRTPSMLQLPADEHQLILVRRLNALGTTSGERDYRFWSDGTLISENPFYTLTYPVSLSLNQSLQAELVDAETGNTTGETVTLPADTQLQWFRSDGEDLCDLRLEDGRAVRVLVNRSSWPYTVSGVDVEQLFSGIMFAG